MKDHDRERFERLLLPHLDSAYALAWWLTRDENEARDAVQEAYLRALRFFPSFRGEQGRGWLLKIVRNACHELRERERHGSRSEFDEEVIDPEGVAAGSVPGSAECSARICRASCLPLPRQALRVPSHRTALAPGALCR